MEARYFTQLDAELWWEPWSDVEMPGSCLMDPGVVGRIGVVLVGVVLRHSQLKMPVWFCWD